MTRNTRCHVLLAVVLGCFVSVGAYADINDSGKEIQWSYKGNLGPARWGQIDPHFMVCAEGERQAPINIRNNATSAPYALKVHVTDAPMVIMDNGDTSLMLGKDRVISNTGHSIQLDFKGKEQGEYITFAGQQYELQQFHFHSPSETLLKGVSFPMEIHFVFQGKDGKAAVLAVVVKAGNENPALEKIVDHIPTEEAKPFNISDEKINPADLLPMKKDYYAFTGSLTTPPCTEGLQWIVMPNPITASTGQIMKLRKAAGGDNARPVQPSHHRDITYSVENKA